MNKIMTVSAGISAAALLIFSATPAMARVDVDLNIGVPGHVYVQPQPVYVQPRPVYVHQRPVYYAPQPYYSDRHYHKYDKHHKHHRHHGHRNDHDDDDD